MSMYVDVGKLGEFSEMARGGAESAADNLGELTDRDVSVGVSRVNLISGTQVVDSVTDDDVIAVGIGLEGFVDGQVITMFDETSARNIAEAFMPVLDGLTDEFGSKHESAIEEVCNIIVSGYVDGWANDEDAAIEMSPPYPIADAADVQGVEATGDESQFSFEDTCILHQRSEIHSTDGDASFSMYLLLEDQSLESVLGGRSGTSDVVDVDTLATLMEVADDGSDKVSTYVQQMTDIDATVDVTSLDFVPVTALSESEENEMSVGVALAFGDDPSGYFHVLLDEDSAGSVAMALDPQLSDPPDLADGIDDRNRSGLGEFGNIVASGFVDAWADHFGWSIEISTPEVVHDMRKAILNAAVVRLATEQQYVLNLRTTIEASETTFDASIYVLVSLTDLLVEEPP
jgi:chemotaxis protein CheC